MRCWILLLFTASLVLAETRSGILVDARCYAAEERNTDMASAAGTSDRDMDFELRTCAPTAKTKLFEVVQNNWDRLKLDVAGNAEASKLVQNTGKQSYVRVVVNGEVGQNTIRVSSIRLDSSMAKR